MLTEHDALVEQVARIIDPSSWRVMDSYLEQTKRKYRGQNVGWPVEQYQDKASMAKARQILSIIRTTDAARIAELEGLLAEFVEVNDEPCHLDHHGYCQTHFLEEDCVVKRARATLRRNPDAG